MTDDLVALPGENNRWSPIWVVPLVALLLGIWMLYDHLSNQGPVITISFDTAEGLEAGKTRIKTRSVEVGKVEAVILNPSMDGVLVTARIDKQASQLLTRDARFWVVRPRIGNSGVSGLGTLLSGAYLELEPGNSDESGRQFVGLEDIPLTSGSTPGVAINLFSDGKQSLSIADPVLYRGFKVGQVESVEFDTDEKLARYRLFINAPYDSLVSSNTHFWNVSGIEVEANAEGVSISSGSLESLLTGGVSFAVPPDLPLGEPATNQASFRLFSNYKAAINRQYDFQLEYLIFLKDSVRGLATNASVEYRGLRIGSVAAINIETSNRPDDDGELSTMIPVLIHLEPARIGYADDASGAETFQQDFSGWLRRGLSARLTTGNLISGSQYVSLDFDDEIAMEFPTSHSGYRVIPSSQDGISHIANKVETLLNKLNELPLQETVSSANSALKAIDAASSSINNILTADDPEAAPQQIKATLQQLNETLAGFSPESDAYRQLQSVLNELRTTLQDVQPLVRDINNNPRALLFGRPRPADQQPAEQ